MSFQPTISKEEIRKLPLIVFQGTTHIIDTSEKATEAIEKLNKEKLIGFDTETKPVFKKGITHKIALVQLSTEKDAYLFRINKIGFPQALISLLENENILKIGADINLDIRGLKKIKPFTPAGFMDIQTMAQSAGITDLSLRKLTAIILKRRLSKRQQLSNWEKEELTLGQQHYAATDACTCLRMYKILNQYQND